MKLSFDVSVNVSKGFFLREIRWVLRQFKTNWSMFGCKTVDIRFFVFCSIDIQATKSLDRRMEHGRQAMCIAAFERVLKNLRHKRDISEDQVKMVRKYSRTVSSTV